MPHYMFCPRKKIISWTLKISGTLIVNNVEALQSFHVEGEEIPQA
jgi:hypothetical protein